MDERQIPPYAKVPPPPVPCYAAPAIREPFRWGEFFKGIGIVGVGTGLLVVFGPVGWFILPLFIFGTIAMGVLLLRSVKRELGIGLLICSGIVVLAASITVMIMLDSLRAFTSPDPF